MPAAITFEQFGSPDVLSFHSVEQPTVGPGQALVRVSAASVNPMDVKIRAGFLEHVFPTVFPATPGLDVAGEVLAVGDGFIGAVVGDSVLGLAVAGSYTTHALVTSVVTKPTTISDDLAACLPTVGEAAFRLLERLDVREGQRLLIHGAAGSVGVIAAQLAIARGLEVIGTASTSDMELLDELGVIEVERGEGWDRRVRDLAPGGVDAVLDTAGADLLEASIALAGSPDRVITIADPRARELGVRFSGADPEDRAPEALQVLADLAGRGQLQLPIWRTYPLAEAAEAHRDLEARRNNGKIVLVP